METLNAAFLQEMRSLLNDEFEAYLDEVTTRPAVRGLRVNTLKITPEAFLRRFSAPLTPTGHTGNGWITEMENPGKYAYHHAGLYYMQEPSAMLPVSLAAPYLGEAVLDLSAAPGGKSGQAAEILAGKGILVSNEPVYSRAKILASNLERLGVTNAMVTNNFPQDLAALLPGTFSAALVDAPCSGEGMFRKEPAAVREWSVKNSEACALRQTEILRSAADCLREGGVLVYSTCTFSLRENEGVLLDFLKTHDFTPVSVPLPPGCLPGIGLPEAVRAYPHRIRGEGHFCCILRKNAPSAETRTQLPHEPVPKLLRQETERILRELGVELSGVPRLSGTRVAYVPENMPFRRGLKIISTGVLAADAEHARLTPAHNLATVSAAQASGKKADFTADSPESAAYLNGQEIACRPPFRGWGFFSADGYPLGLVKATGEVLKNHYPKGLRNR